MRSRKFRHHKKGFYLFGWYGNNNERGTRNSRTFDLHSFDEYFAGRYNKYSRELSQTPWILPDGERKMALSVEEIISNKLKEIMKAAGMNS
jgi:tRNA U54 and U55 pseudouridine synthase Pus10